MTKIGIVTRPSNDRSFTESVYRFVTILEPSSTALSLVTGGIVARESPLSNTIDVGNGEYLDIAPIDYVIFQILLCYYIFKNREDLDLIYFHKGAMGLIFPVLFSRILNIKTCAIKIGAYHGERVNKKTRVDRLMTAIQHLMFWCAHGVVVFSESEVSSIPNKNTFIGYSEYIDFDIFEKQISLPNRPIDIGFVGRLADVKGIKNFTQASLSLVRNNPGLRIRIIGDGPQYKSVERMVAGHDQIELTGWVSHDEIAHEYNQIQILVAPSRAEGLPSTLIEAMGCGVVVLATPVGSVGDLIMDGETGFYLPDRDPDTIEREFKRLNNRSDLNMISERAREDVISDYSKEAVQEQFAKITECLLGSDTTEVTTEVINSNE